MKPGKLTPIFTCKFTCIYPSRISFKLMRYLYSELKFMHKLEKIRRLTSYKTKQFTLTLNPELVSLFKIACNKNKINMTNVVETFMITYIDNNKLLETKSGQDY